MTAQGRRDFNYKLVEFFLTRSRLVLLFLLAIIIGGTFSLLTLRREGFPEVTPKVVGVTTIFPGASSSEVESQVTVPIESALKDLDNLSSLSSTSRNSVSSIVVSLEQQADLDVSLQEIRTRVTSVQNSLPEDTEEPNIATFSTGGATFILAVTGEKSLDQLKALTPSLTAELGDINGIKEVTPLHESEERLVITYDPARLQEVGLNSSQLELILKGNNLDLPLTTLDIGGKKQAIVAQGTYRNQTEIENQIVGLSPAGLPIRLRDVATIEKKINGSEAIERIGLIEKRKLTSKDAVLLSITIAKDADILKTKVALDEKIKELEDEDILDSSVQVTYLLDQSHDTEEQIDEILAGAIGDKNTFYLLGGIQLVLLFMLLFVNWRAAVISALAIPLSFFFTLIWLYLIDVHLNTLVLFSLVLVLGLIVDPAIVMLESIQRYKDLGRNGHDSVLLTALRYGAGLFIAVLTSVIVFIPFGVITGVFGEIIKYIPLTVIPALIASYLIPMTILPALAARVLKGREKGKQLSEDEEIWGPGRAMMKFNKFILDSFVRKVLVLIVVGSFIFFSMQIVVNGKIPFVQFSTPEDNEQLMASMNFPTGSSFSRKDELAKKVEEKIREEGGVENYFYFMQTPENATILVTLKEERSEEDKSKEIMKRLKSSLAEIGELETSVSELSVGPPSQDYPIQVQLFDNDQANLEKAAKEVGSFLKEVEHVEKVDDGFTDRGEVKLGIVFDKTKLAATGLSVFEIGQALKGNLEEKEVTKFESAGVTQQVVLEPKGNSLPQKKEDLAKLKIPTRNGSEITLDQVATIIETTSLDKIERFDGSRFVNVRAKIDNSENLQTVQKELDEFLDAEKIEDLGLESKANRGEDQEIAEGFQQLFVALFAAIFLTYVILVLQFNSFTQPIIMLFTVPLSLVGVFPALVLVNGQLGFLEILGLTILVGIVENVGIFLIDYANQLVKEKGMSLKEAIVISSGVRFRPIILTKLVALGGLLPLAIFSPFWRGLASVIIGGILVSGFLSLAVVPIFYTWFGTLSTRLRKIS